MRKRLALIGFLACLGLVVACGDDGDSDEPFTMRSSPEFVNRVIPGTRPLALVTVDGGDGAVRLAATADVSGVAVTAAPTEIAAGEVAEIWAEVPVVVEDTPVSVTVTGTRGDTNQSVTFTFTAVPGTDDLAGTATEIAAVFLDQLAGTVPGLPADVAGLTGGTPVAGLLVVSHYAWFTDDLEICLAWHIMIAPDDFAEMYVRPRGSFTPTQAFRLESWSTALAGGDATVTEIPPPPEVTR